MQRLIRQKLNEIERKEGVRIIFAVESGSRAWGFASPDSDYDVRFIYVRKAEDYLKIIPLRDVIEWQLDETLDINGWDLKKALRLLLKSNPTLFEWANSPVVYRVTDEWEWVRPLIHQYFSSKAGMYHYLNMASGNYREYLKTDMVRVKKYLYVLRPILACKWILDYGTQPPTLFEQLMACELEPGLQPVVLALLERKRNASEIEMMPRIHALNAYIEESLATLLIQAGKQLSTRNGGSEKLDSLFLRILNGESADSR